MHHTRFHRRIASPHSLREDSTVRLWDIRAAKAQRCIARVFGGDSVNSVAWHPLLTGDTDTDTETQGQHLFAAAGQTVYQFDLRMPGVVLSSAVASYALDSDEVNQVAVHHHGEYLAAADDSGLVSVLEVRRLLSLEKATCAA